MDNLIICDRCGSDACYVQEVNQDIKNYQCYGCGFITNSVMTRDSRFLEEQMELLPNLHKELMGEDEKGKYPIPGKKGEFYKKRMDMDTIKEFGERDYLEALDFIGVFTQDVENEG